MKKLENYLIWFTLLGGSFSSLEADSAPDTKGTAVPTDAKASGASVPSKDIPVFSEEVTLKYLRMYGFLVGSNANLSALGLKNEKEKKAVSGGVEDCIEGKPQPPDLDSKWPDIETFLFQREKEKLENTKKEGEAFLAKQAKEPGYRTENGIVFEIVALGDGVRATGTSTVKVSYTGKCNGVIIDSGENVELNLGETMPGFVQGVQLVGQGGQVHLFISPSLGYGDESFGSVPGGSVLEFTITIHSITNTPETPAPAATSTAASASAPANVK
ncbi:MAG: FKBP-type peptidyl-prolyl cis-trans isomerase [Puniceicoccales bacterium]|jgi:FKBP-type peptidyl-prolyl cis-trans isomerase|nr:FKBP-type peptidyl-prolyl cis-trans isomerase [Puniceicoccales bacterium]